VSALTIDEVYEALKESGHYVVKANWEMFRLINGRLDIAPDWPAITRELNKAKLRDLTKDMQDTIFGTHGTPPTWRKR
jgi:hypothetical protein